MPHTRTITLDLDLDDYIALRSGLTDRAEKQLDFARDRVETDPTFALHGCRAHATAVDVLARLDVAWFAASRVDAGRPS